MKLEIESIPEKSWGTSLANLLPKPVWDTLRREVYGRFNYQCCICGAVDIQVHCHEKWRYDDRKRIQYLVELQCLCVDCHNVKHFGRTVALVHEGKLTWDHLLRLTDHFLRVNSCTQEDFVLHKLAVGTLNYRRSKHLYKVDFGKFDPGSVVAVWRKVKKGGSK